MIKLQPHIIMGDLIAHNSHRRDQLNAVEENADVPSRDVFQMREVDFNFTRSSHGEGQMNLTNCNPSVKPNVIIRPWRSWSNSLMNGTIGVHYLNKQLLPHCMSESSESFPPFLIYSVIPVRLLIFYRLDCPHSPARLVSEEGMGHPGSKGNIRMESKPASLAYGS